MKECFEYRIELCGENYNYIAQFQADYKKKHKRHLSIKQAIQLIITNTRTNGSNWNGKEGN